MGVLDFDLFSSEFYFKLGLKNYKKGTLYGTMLSLIAILAITLYFSYLLYQYSNNLIDPKFRSQSFIMNSRIDISLVSNLIGFIFFYNSSITIDQFQAQQNQTYFVYIVQFYYQDGTNQVFKQFNLDFKTCEDPSLKMFNCIDFSPIRDYQLILDSQNNVQSQIYINMYGCNDLDSIKTTIPDNCAPQNEIDKIVNGLEASFYVRLKAQQFNTTSKEIQTNYRNMYLYGLSSQFSLTTVKTQKQETKVESGLLFQQEQIYSSPIQYDFSSQTFDRQVSLGHGLGPYFRTAIVVDEIVQQFYIQYPTITEILALVNSVASIVVIFRFIGRHCSQNLIQQDLFKVVLRNLFLDKFSQLAIKNNLLQQNHEIHHKSQSSQQEIMEDLQENQNPKNIQIPNLQTKFRGHIEKTQNNCENQKYLSPKNILNTVVDEQEQTNNEPSLRTRQSSRVSKISLLDGYSNQKKLNQNYSNLYFFTPKSHAITKKQILQEDENKQKTKFFVKKCNVKQDRNVKLNTTEGIEFVDRKNNQNRSDFIDQKVKVFDSPQIKQSVFILKFLKSKQVFKRKGIDPKYMNRIKQQACSNLNIFNFYKDIIFLKKAVAMLLTHDQLAALQIITLTDNFLDLDLNSDDLKLSYQSNFIFIQQILKILLKCLEVKNKLNHFEKHNCILQSEELLSHYLEKFFNRCQNDKNLNHIDKRIISSVIKNE